MRKIPPPTKPELVINDIELRKAKLLLRAINHRLRQQILQFIHSKKQTPVTPLYVSLHLEQSVASQHLAILRRAGLVITTKEGKFIYYSVNYQKIDDMHKVVKNFLSV